MSPRGGARKGAGKPALYGERMVRAEILIPQEAKEFFVSLGKGNLSAGVRKAWESIIQREMEVCAMRGKCSKVGVDDFGKCWSCGKHRR